jgi:hypothetical protein
MVLAEIPITNLRWVISHVPQMTVDLVNRFKAIGGGLLVGWGPLRTGMNVGPAYRMLDDGKHQTGIQVNRSPVLGRAPRARPATERAASLDGADRPGDGANSDLLRDGKGQGHGRDGCAHDVAGGLHRGLHMAGPRRRWTCTRRNTPGPVLPARCRAIACGAARTPGASARCSHSPGRTSVRRESWRTISGGPVRAISLTAFASGDTHAAR